MQIVFLSEKFYKEHRTHKEILPKKHRPYLIVSVDDVRYGIPFRHHIRHKNSFITSGEAGLDYAKAVVLTDDRYIGSSARINTIDHSRVMVNFHKIRLGFVKFLKEYRRSRREPRFSFCALQYFDLD